MKVYDKDMFMDEIVGSATIYLSFLCKDRPVDSWFPIIYRGKKAGMLRLRGNYRSFTPTVKPTPKPKPSPPKPVDNEKKRLAPRVYPNMPLEEFKKAC